MRPMLVTSAALAFAALATPAAAQHMRRQQAGDDSNLPQQRARPETPTILVEPVGMMIAAFDADGDGKVTRAEFDAGLKHSFDAIDTGHTGALGYIEFGDWAERWLGDRNTLPSPFEVDRDGDNRITFDELKQRFDLYFTQFDRNKDGVIERSELLTIRAPSLNSGGGHHGRGGFGGGFGGRGRRGGGEDGE